MIVEENFNKNDSKVFQEILIQNDKDKIIDNQDSSLATNFEENKKLDQINPKETKEVDDSNSKELTDIINKEYHSSNESENVNSTMNVAEFKLIMEKTERVVDVIPSQEQIEVKKEEIKQTNEKDFSNNNPSSISIEVSNNNNNIPISKDQEIMIKPEEQRDNGSIIENKAEKTKVGAIQNPANEIPKDIKITDLTEMQEYKLYYNYLEPHMIRVAKYLEKEIIIICNEIKNEEPNFFYQAHYSIDDLIKISKIFENYKEDNKLYEFFINSFDNNNAKLTKDVNEKSYINLIIKVILFDGNDINFMLQLFRKERDYNIDFYDTYINVKKEQENKKVLNSYEEEKYYHHSINYNHAVLEEYSKIKIPGQIIDPEVENMENNKKRRKSPKKILKSGDEEKDLLHYFNTKYRLKMTGKDKQIDLYDKGLVSDDVNKLCKIGFQNVEILYLNNNKIINIDAFEYSVFPSLKILRLNNNVIAKIGKLGSCSFLSQLTELYLYNNKLTSLDEFSGVDFSELRILHISNNCLTNVDALGNCKFKNLNQLLLYDNQISQIDNLGNCDFSKLKVLSIYYNRLTNVNSLAKTNLGNLSEMTLSRNKINNVDDFPKMNLANLKLLVLHNNCINNIEPLTRCNFFELKNCLMYCNKISKVSAKNQKAIADMKSKYPKLTYLRI